MKKVILTGATGLIGKEALQPLIDAGYEIFALTTDIKKATAQANWLELDIFDHQRMEKIFREIQPEYLLHFAWTTDEGYLTSELNYKYLDASINMLEAFTKNGGKRAVFAGTCLEYEFKDTPLKESDKLNPLTVYAECKNALREKAEYFAKENNISFAWGRIFFVYGHDEHPKRLTADIINSLKNNRKVIIRSGKLVRDYMYSKDVAEAFVKLLGSDIKGCINICSGKGITIKDFAMKIAEKMKKTELLEFMDDAGEQPSVIIGDNTKLLSGLKYNYTHSILKSF